MVLFVSLIPLHVVVRNPKTIQIAILVSRYIYLCLVALEGSFNFVSGLYLPDFNDIIVLYSYDYCLYFHSLISFFLKGSPKHTNNYGCNYHLHAPISAILWKASDV